MARKTEQPNTTGPRRASPPSRPGKRRKPRRKGDNAYVSILDARRTPPISSNVEVGHARPLPASAFVIRRYLEIHQLALKTAGFPGPERNPGRHPDTADDLRRTAETQPQQQADGESQQQIGRASCRER